MKFFLIAAGSIAALILVGILGMVLLRRALLPSPLRKSRMAPSGARPWQRARSAASMHGFASWHGTQTLAGAPVQPPVALAAPALPGPITPGLRPGPEMPFSQAAAAWSRAHSGPLAYTPPAQMPAAPPANAYLPQAQPLPTPAYYPQPAPPQQQPVSPIVPDTSTLGQNTTPFANYNQAATNWGGHTFASWSPPPPSTNPHNGASTGNTGKFRRNSLMPLADVPQPGTNEV